MQERQLLADVLKRRKRRGSDGPSRLDLVDRSAHMRHLWGSMMSLTGQSKGRQANTQALGVGCRDKTTEMHSDLDENFILITSYFYYIFTQISILSITFY